MKTLFTIAIVSTALAGAAEAATVGFDLTISGSANGPTFSVTNTSSSAAITGGRAVIGNTAYNFDCVMTNTVVAPAGGTVGFSTPELASSCFPGGGLRSDEIVFQATDFDPGETLSFGTDIDPDFSDATVSDFNILLNGGSFEVTFADADLNAPLVALFQPGQKTYSVSATTGGPVGPSTVPLPAGGALILTALGALGAVARRKAR